MDINRNQLSRQMKVRYKKLVKLELIKIWTGILAVWLHRKVRYYYRKIEA